jgi:hypothetical protein
MMRVRSDVLKMFGRLVCVEYRAKVFQVAIGYCESAGDGTRAGLVDLGNVGEACEGIEGNDPAVRVVRLVDATECGEGGDMASPVNAELHDHAGNVKYHPVQRVE